jgi:hypothetical protein
MTLHPQAHSFELECDTSKFGAYTRGGIVTQHKEGKVLAFKKLADALEEPGEFLLSDFSKIERSPLLHLAFQALDAYQVRLAGAVALLYRTGASSSTDAAGSSCAEVQLCAELHMYTSHQNRC